MNSDVKKNPSIRLDSYAYSCILIRCNMVMKARRKAVILELVDREAITSQEQLREKLRERGIEATQATLSRDIRELGLVKRSVDGAYRRSGGDVPGAGGEAALRRAVEEYLRTQETIEQLLVLRTDPGQAQSLAIAIDRARLSEIAGTIGGDDTILVICRSATDASSIAERFRSMR
jgi:transcriptional regulator of arginine metabolism